MAERFVHQQPCLDRVEHGSAGRNATGASDLMYVSYSRASIVTLIPTFPHSRTSAFPHFTGSVIGENLGWMFVSDTFGVEPPGFRLPAGTSVGRVRLQVSDLERSMAYYREVIGLRVLEAGPASAALGVQASSRLVELEARPGTRSVGPGAVLGLYHFAILLPDRASLGRFVRHLAARQVQFASADHLVSEAVYLWDPDGLGIEVYADRPRDAWQINSGELVMAAEPLDLRMLLHAGGAEPWDAAPLGTSMGHVHLSVDDLGRARDFYHSALGLDITVSSYPGALFLSVGGYHHHLGLNTWAPRARRSTPEDARLLEWQLVVPKSHDVGAAAASLRDSDYEVTQAPSEAVAIDPWGTTVRLASLASKD